MITVGSDFSGVGAFNQALKRLNIEYKEMFACDMDKYARQTFVHNNGEPEYYPENVYDRAIPLKRLDIYMTSPPCQAFSLAGKREGENSDKGVLFYNSHEFISINKPRFFIFENVKGLLSDDNGKTFQRWISYLGGKSVNGNTTLFPHEKAVPYHVYYQVMNAKNYGVPQNRERIFIIGIRDDCDNNFTFPREIPLTKRLKDVLEENVPEKYYLSEKMIAGLLKTNDKHESKGNGFVHKPKNENDIANCLRANGALNSTDNTLKVGFINQDTQASQVFSTDGLSPTVCAGTHGYALGYIQQYDFPKVEIQLTGGKWDKTHEQSGRVYSENGISPAIHTMQGGNQEIKVQIKSNTEKGFDTLTENDTLNFSQPTSKTRRGRIGKGVAQTLDTACNQAVIGAIRGRGDNNTQQLEINNTGNCNSITTVQKDNVVVCVSVMTNKQTEKIKNIKVDENIAGCITNAIARGGSSDEYIKSIKRNLMITKSIRRLTPRECFRLMDFPDTFTWPVSDSQAYKQAGNSIVVSCLVEIIRKLNL